MKNHSFITTAIVIFFITGCTGKPITDAPTPPSTPTEVLPTTIVAPIVKTEETASTPLPPKKPTTLTKNQKQGEAVIYDGKITISGTFTLYHENDAFLGEMLCFEADAETGYLIPREEQTYWGGNVEMDTRSPWFCFSNQDDAKLSFFSANSLPNPKCNHGTATIEISEYVVTLMERAAHDSAKLEKVITKTPGSDC